jgi:hypothetical protein
MRPTLDRVDSRSFEVIAVGGQPLPVDLLTMGRGACVQQQLGRATLSFLADGSFRLTHWVLPHDTIPGSVLSTTWSQDATGRVFISDAGALGVGTLNGDTLSLDLPAYIPGLFCVPQTIVAVSN